MFQDQSRQILDQALYPNIYRRESNFRFTFQTFNITKEEQYFDSILNLDIDLDSFWHMHVEYFYKNLVNSNGNPQILCKFDNFWIPPNSIVTYDKYTTKEKKQIRGKKNFSNWHLDSEIDKDYIKWGDTYPKNEFVFTKSTEATINFNMPVFFRYAFARMAYNHYHKVFPHGNKSSFPNDEKLAIDGSYIQ